MVGKVHPICYDWYEAKYLFVSAVSGWKDEAGFLAECKLEGIPVMIPGSLRTERVRFTPCAPWCGEHSFHFEEKSSGRGSFMAYIVECE